MQKTSPVAVLDDASRAPGLTLSDYCTQCSTAVDRALDEWPVARESTNARVSYGYVEGNRLLSLLWTTTFSNPPERLLEKLEELFAGGGEDLKRHASEWDRTFHDADVVGTLEDLQVADADLAAAPLLVHWQFNAPPLAGRDMLYAVASKREEPDGNDWNARTVYAYASVRDAWAEKATGKNIRRTGRTRALNCFPSCDRVTVYPDRVQLDHLMTTEIGGWVPVWCFNNLFKSALVDANAHESEQMRAYVLSLCGGRE